MTFVAWTFAAVMASIGLAPAALASHGGTRVPAVTATPHVTATIPVGSGPTAIAGDRLTGKVYATNANGGTVWVINGKTNKVVATIRGFFDPRAVAADPRTGRVYVTWFDNHQQRQQDIGHQRAHGQGHRNDLRRGRRRGDSGQSGDRQNLRR